MGCMKCPYYDYELGNQYCDKVGGKTLIFGYCEDAYPEMSRQKTIPNKKRRNKRERDHKYKNHLKFLAQNIQYYPTPVIYTDWIKVNSYIKNPKPYYKRYYRDNHKGGKYKYHKKYSNRCVRRYKGEIHSKGNQYRKIFDYWRIV